jgi:hypothetical protein
VAKFQPGQSGNPNGRPKKERALTDLLERAGNVVIEDGEGGRSARKRIVAALSWKLLTEGEATLPNGKRLVLAPAEWASLYKWIYTHIDGPAKAEIDVTTGGKPIVLTDDQIVERITALLLRIEQRKAEQDQHAD